MLKLINAFTNDALGNLDAVAIAQRIAKKELSVEEVIEAAIIRAESVNPALNAIVIKTYDDARRISKKSPRGGLHGVPIFIKDSDHIRGYPTQLGTDSFKSKTAKRNSKYVRQMFSTGLISLGKSSMPEYGLVCSKESHQWGTTRNPWNTDYTTGGSSSGSAALVASGVVPIASANDGAGSIRIPAAICGLVGLKPTRNRVYSMDGTELLPIQTIHQGVLTRSVRDTALFFSEAEKFYYNKKLPKLNYIKNAGKKRLKIAFFQNPVKGALGHQDFDTFRSQNETAKLLSSLGHHVDLIPIPISVDSMTDLYLNYYGFQAYMTTYMSRFSLKAKVNLNTLEPFTAGLTKKFKSNMLKLPGNIRKVLKMGREFENLFKKYDLLMSPTMAHKTPKIGYFSSQISTEEITHKVLRFATYTAVQNITGSPAISLPMNTDSDGLPLGVHFMAPYGFDKRLIEIAYELEEAKPWKSIYEV